MSLASFVERHGRAILTVTILLAAAGLFSAFQLPSDIYPPLIFPRVVVIGHSGTLPARTMMLTVTRPIEQALLEVPGIRRVRSKTFRGSTEISGQFDSTTDMVLALQQAQGRIAEARGSLPADLELTIERLTPAAFPFLSLNLSGGGLRSADLYDYAFFVMRPALSRVAGVGSVEVLSTDQPEIEVIADPAKLTATGLTIGNLADALEAANSLQPVGRYNASGLQHLVLASGMWNGIEDIPATPIVVKGGTTIRVSDLATVERGAPDRTSLVSGDGKVAANISISQQIGANILQVRAGVETALAELAKALPSGLTLSKTYDLAEFVATAIANVRDAILLGGALAVIVLLLFLRDWRLTLVASVTLPLTVMTTFLVMRWLGQTINVMSMGGMAVAIGLVIDDAVVVVENIYRHLDGGEAPGKAVELAMHEIVAPVVGSTLTTVVVFVPLGMLSGVVGQFFKSLSITLAAAVMISLVQALTLIPILARAAAKRREKQHVAEHHHAPLERFYAGTLDATMRRPALGLIVALALAVAGGLLFTRIGTGFLPEADEGGFVIDYNAPAGSSLEEIDRTVVRMEAVLQQTPAIAAFTRRTGSELGLFATQQTKGDILVRLKPAGDRKPASEIIDELRDKLGEAAPTFEVEFVQLLQDMLGDLEGAAEPIEVKVFGDDPQTLADISEQVEQLMEHTTGVVDIVGVQRGNPETTWNVDLAAVGRLGLSVSQVSEQLSDAWLGDIRTNLRLSDRTIPIRVRYPDAYRLDPARMATTPLRADDGRTVPLGAVAQAATTEGEFVLERENLRQMALVTGRLEGRDLGSAVSELQGKLTQLKLPVGYTAEVGGQYESQQRSFQELLTVFAIAAALVFVILVVQFRAFLPALLILLAAPLSLAGAFALLLLTGTDLNVSSAMGLILLVGLVVKNGIVLIDYAHRLRDEGRPFTEALEIAGRVRLRPILMTTLCTLFGLLPLALGFGAGAELQRPLALAVIGGLTLSTFVTLYLVPLAYRALSRAA